MTKINFENDRMQSVEQIDSAKRLSDKVLELKDLEDEVANAEESLKKLTIRISHYFFIPQYQYSALKVKLSFKKIIENSVHI